MTAPYSQNPGGERYFVPFAFEQLTIAGTAAGLTSTVYAGAVRAVITTETASLRYTADGVTTPTSAVGILVASGSQILLLGKEIQNFQAIRTTGTSAGLDCEYSK